MKMNLPISVLQTIQTFQNANAEIYVVGGAVRDLLSGKEVKDWDFTTNLSPEEIIKLFPPDDTFYDNQFGTVGVKIPILRHSEHSEESSQEDPSVASLPQDDVREKEEYDIFEVTTFRTESNYEDRRRPGKVEWGKSLEEDLKRRDFTINAMAVSIKDSRGFGTKDSHGTDLTDNKIDTNPRNPISGNPAGLIRENPSDEVEVDIELIDLYHGQEDLNNKLIRAVGVSDERFQEDALRMMRAIRISTELGFQIEPKTFEAIKNNSQLLKEIAQERITEEFRKILASKFPVEGIKFLQTTGILELLIPELLEGYGMKQKGHHIYDVYEHSLKALQFCENPNWVVRFAALIHDIGKPVTARGEGEARTFYNHEIVGTNIAWNIAKRMKLTREETKKLTTLVRWHMFSVSEFLTDAAIRRFIRRVGTENIQDMMDVRIGDRLGSGCTTAEGWRLRDFKERIIEVQKHIPSVTDLKVNGKDVMEVLKVSPGPIIGKILNELFEEIMDNPAKNEREYLLERIKKYELN